MLGSQTSLFSAELAGGGAGTLWDEATSLWLLNEASGTRVDSIGSNDLTDNNTVGYQNMGPTGVIARGTNADDDYLSHASVGTFAAGESHTWAFWYRDNTAGTTTGALIARDNGSTREWAITTGNTVFTFLVFDAGGTATTIDSNVDFSELFAKNQWHFAVVWFDSSDNTLHYQIDNGTARGKAGTGDVRGGTATTTMLWSQFYNTADLDLARVGYWNGLLDASTRTSLYNAGKGKSYSELAGAELTNLVSYWNLDEASGNRADSHGSNTLTDNNTVGSTTNSYPANLPGRVASFVAANSESLSSTGVTLAEDFTVSVWINTTSVVNDTCVFSVGDTWPNSIQANIRLTNTGLLSVLVGSGGGSVQSANNAFTGVTLNDGAWHLLVVTFTDADQKIRVYADDVEGNQSPSSALGASHYSASSLLEFGHQAALSYLTYAASSAAIWDHVLTSDERAALYNSGDGLALP